jgi:hypothetical protein
VIAASLLLSLLAAPEVPPGFALLAGRAPGDDPTEALGAIATLADALRARGVSVSAGTAVWRGLGSELREVGSDLPAGAEGVFDAAGRSFEEGRFAEAARFAEEAVARLDHAPRSVSVEARERAAQVLYGLALLSVSGQEEVARSHLLWTLERDPGFALDSSRFAPPLRQPLDQARRAAQLLPQGSLTVAGTSGASVYVDGLLSGQAPLTIASMPLHSAWIWLERAGRRSFAHRVDLESRSTSVAIDLDLEARLAMNSPTSSEGQPIFTALRGDPETPGLLQRLSAALAMRGVAVLSRCAGAGCWRLEAVASGRSIALERHVAAAARPPLDDLAAGLLAEAGTGEGELEPAAAPTAAASSTARAPTATTETSSQPAKAWPWVVAGVAVAAVGAGVGLYFALKTSAAPPTDVGVYSSTGSP